MFENTVICGVVHLGKRGENLARKIYFEESSTWKKEFGDGVYELFHQRNGDTAPYPVLLTTDKDAIYWKVTASDTAVEGEGKCELRYIVKDIVVKSQTYKTIVSEGLNEASSEAPAPQKEWVDQVIESGIIAKKSASNASASAEQASKSAQIAKESASKAEKANQETQTASEDVKEAWNNIEKHQKECNNIFANSLNGNVTTSNRAVAIKDDVSPIEHNILIKYNSFVSRHVSVFGKNLLTLDGASLRNCELYNSEYNAVKLAMTNNHYCVIRPEGIEQLFQLLDGCSVTFSASAILPNAYMNIVVFYTDGTWVQGRGEQGENYCAITLNHGDKTIKSVELRSIQLSYPITDTSYVTKNLQLEIGGISEFEQYKGRHDYYIRVSGDNVISYMSPSITVIQKDDLYSMTIQYNRDINQALEGINSEALELASDVVDLHHEVEELNSDIDAALNGILAQQKSVLAQQQSIIDIQNNLIGGERV